MCIVLSLFSILFLTTDCQSQQAGETGYEAPGILRASEILPPELLEGEHYKVMEEVATYDLTNHFTISTAFGQFEVKLGSRIAISGKKSWVTTKLFGLWLSS